MKKQIKTILKSILYFNLFFYIEYKWGRKKTSSQFKDYLSIVAIVKNEALNIAEWIEYHLLVGVSRFYIYDNGSTDNLKEVLEPYIQKNIVEYIYYPGKARQTPAYNAAIKRIRNQSFWIATIDIDEFIVPVSTQTIPDFLRDFEDVSGIEINWMMYGSNGQRERTEGLVMERFTKHAFADYPLNRHIKTVFNPRSVWVAGVHEAQYFDGKGVNTHKEEIQNYFLEREPLFDKIRINHYFCKSETEYLLKLGRGDATGNNHLSMTHFHNQDKNDMEDDIMNKYIPRVKKNLIERYRNQ
ncbi:hypothetical protein AGMMS49965_18070 [Bacteroidia bacterium]|nr:hypothetical protein AGMMS49965_18070 [Bacteroidia bacterium]